MTNINAKLPAPLSGEPIIIDGKGAYRIHLTGRDGAGKFALVDPEGLERLRQAGASQLYLVNNGHGDHYVTFLKLPTYNQSTAARVIIDAPSRRRVINVNGDRLDLRTANLMVQPRKEEPAPRLAQGKAYAINQGWQAHGKQRRREEGAWKQAAISSGPAE